MFQKLKFTGLALAGIIMVSAASVPVSAAGNSCNHSSTRLNVTTYYTDPSPTHHLVVTEYTYTCTTCGEVTENFSDVYWEEHDYEYNYTTNELCCHKCGDHYK